MIKVADLKKRYGKVDALSGLSFEVPEGSIYGFVGPNGAGKTTTIRILATLLVPDSGRAWVCGAEVSDQPGEVRQQLGYMPDFFGVYDNLTALEYLQFYAAAHGIRHDKARKVAMDLLELLDLSAKAADFVDTLSRGMKQRLCLARALVHDPKVLLLDEPASGLDPRARVEMRELLKELADMGKTILVSSHILSELAELCTDVGIISNGVMVTSGRVGEVMQRLESSRVLRIRALSGHELAAKLLSQCSGVTSVTWTEAQVSAAFSGGPDEIRLALKTLVDADIPVISFSEDKSSLEQVFMQLTAGSDGR